MSHRAASGVIKRGAMEAGHRETLEFPRKHSWFPVLEIINNPGG